MTSEQQAAAPGTRLRVAEIECLYGAMLDCLTPPPAERPEPAADHDLSGSLEQSSRA
ncbi:hypothetical protein ACGF5O_22260 [Streptomyces sp. NPDC048291]|uniref:hypothetical protein n=1 Tax=Streptomyces sp. NPDC048291 TaxID=3365530 RepID=UPI0037196817